MTSEVGGRKVELQKQIFNCKSQIFQRDRSMKINALTIKELNDLKDKKNDLKTYRSLGKMFVSVKVSELENELNAKIEKEKREFGILEKTLQHLEKTMKDLN
jgi:chaperonin cofactor prefoldin